ncbi:MAG: chemotaxis protein CheA [Bacillota bacterium]
MEQYRDLFLAEARDYLQSMTDHLLELEKDPAETGHLTEIFRSAHSLKGMAGTMGYELISALTHAMETLLDSLRGGSIEVETKMVSLLFEAVDLVQLMVDNLDRQENYRDNVVELEKRLLAWQGKEKEKAKAGDLLTPVDIPQTEIQRPGKQEEKSQPSDTVNITVNITEAFNEYEKELLKDVVAKGEFVYHVHVWLREGSLLKSVRAYMVFKALEGQCEIVKTVPSMQELDEGLFDRDFYLIVAGSPALDEMRRSIEGIAEIERVQITSLQDLVFELEVATTDAVALPVEELDATLPPNDAPARTIAKEMAGLAECREEEAAAPETKKVNTASVTRAAEKTVRVETAKLDTLVNLVGELIINRTRVVELGKRMDDELLHGSLEHLERITTDLQSAVMTLRMVPIKQVFDRFPRMVRDLSIERNKEVELVISGEETELDRTIVNQVGDPLVHLLRNAVDHGIETPEERRQKGKNPVGRIVLEAHHEGSHVVVSVSDDGRGINPEIIKAKALEKGMISREEVEEMTTDELTQIIFRSGFSTSREITDVSGRGVGMDVVKAGVEALNGTVEVKSEKGGGTHFVLRLPLTLAIIRTLMVKAGKEIYAIPIEAIRENIFVEPHEIKTINQVRVITLREEVLPLKSLNEALGMGSFEEEQEVYPVVVVRAGNKKAGLVVDELLGQQEIVIKSLSSFISDIKGIAGATVLGDGRVTLILDVASLLEDGRVSIGKKSSHH